MVKFRKTKIAKEKFIKSFYKNLGCSRYTNANFKISLYVLIHIKIIP